MLSELRSIIVIIRKQYFVIGIIAISYLKESTNYSYFETYLSLSLVEEMVSVNVSIDQLLSSIRKYANHLCSNCQ